MTNRITLQEWVANYGSIRAASEFLGVPASTLGAYCRGERFPSPPILRQLIVEIGDQVDFTALASAWVKNHDTRPPRRRRLRPSLLVADADRLRVIYGELGLNVSGIEKAPKILPRWQTTKVTVGEVRAAVAELKQARRNPSDLSLIHDAIATARRSALRSLNQ